MFIDNYIQVHSKWAFWHSNDQFSTYIKRKKASSKFEISEFETPSFESPVGNKLREKRIQKYFK